jgi:hypothetical protein
LQGERLVVRVTGQYGAVVWKGSFPFHGSSWMDTFLWSKDLLMGMLKKPQWKDKPAGQAVSAAKDEISILYPMLWAFLAESSYADGSERATGTVTLSVEDGSVKACLRDRQEARILFVSGNTLSACLDNANCAVEEDGADWRPDKFAPKKRERKN